MRIPILISRNYIDNKHEFSGVIRIYIRVEFLFNCVIYIYRILTGYQMFFETTCQDLMQHHCDDT